MAAKTATPPQKEAPTAKVSRIEKSKKKGTRRRYKLNLKGWLKTPADWARFDAWAKINAQPRSIPEPEVIVRPSKPLSRLMKRIQVLSQPGKQYDPSIHCRLDLSISKAALKAVPTKRINELALPMIRIIDHCREFPVKISIAALKYTASPRIIELSQPHVWMPEECLSFATEPFAVSKSAMKHKTTEREKRLALAKKLMECPELLTEEEREELLTTNGIRKSALKYKLTSWMSVLWLPSYKNLKDRKDSDAIAWKKLLIEAAERRGKKALEEQKRKRAKPKKARKRKYAEMEGAGDNEKETTDEQKEEDEEDEVPKEEKATAGEGEENKEDEAAERRAKRRRIEKNAWRFSPPNCKEDPHFISRAALKAQGSPRIIKLAEARIFKNLHCRDDPYSVKKSALSATATERVEVLAKPMNPRSPVEKKPPREKDEYGMPIFEKQVYGKVLPKTKPYKMGDCNPPEKEEIKKSRPINPIAYQPTVDPCIDPRLAKIQKKERKRMKKSSRKRGRKQRKPKDEGKSQKETEADKPDPQVPEIIVTEPEEEEQN